MDPLALQRQLRHNSKDLENYFEDLKQWGKEMKRKDDSLKIGVESTENGAPLPRNAPQDVPSAKAKTNKPKKKMSSSDYAAWDKFDVDAECAKLDGVEVEEEAADDSSDLSDECDESRIDESNYEKDKGNKFVQHQKWDEAIECYTKAIEYYAYNPIFYANRALCHLKKLKYKSAESDCTTALQLDKTYVKAYQRRAAAREALNQLVEARSDLMKVFDFEPNNKESKAALGKLEKKMEGTKKPSVAQVENKPLIKKPEIQPTSETQRPKSKFTLSRQLQREKKSEQIPSTSTIAKVERDVVQTEKPKIETYWPSGNEIELVQKVQKPPHFRSKKPLKRVEIRDVDPVIIPRENNEPFPRSVDNMTIKCDDLKVIERKNPSSLVKVSKPKKISNFEATNESGKILDVKTSLNVEKEIVQPRVEPEFNLPVPSNAVQFFSDWKFLKNNLSWKYRYLEQLDPKNIPSIFKESLDSETFTEILYTLARATSLQNIKINVFNYLVSLSNVKRFSMLSMFMSDEDKKEFLKIIEHLRGSLEVKSSDLDELISKYGV